MRLAITVVFFAFVFNSVASATNYYVSPDGNDSNPGTMAKPWKTWKKAFSSSSVKPGDTVFFRGGVYYEGGQLMVTRSGTAGNPVCFHSYPGEKPILDCKNYVPTGDPNSSQQWYNEVIYVQDQKHIEFNGLTIRNVRQSPDHMTDCKGFYFVFGTEIKAINCTAYNIGGIGFYSRFKEEGNHYFINCDAYHCVDSLSPPPDYLPGNRGTGFGSYNFTKAAGHVYYYGCRAWLCGDQGFASMDPYHEWDHCWSFNNGLLQGSGFGWKLGWVTLSSNKVRRVMKNCIAAYNQYAAVHTNESGNEYVAHSNIYNNSFYHNGYRMDAGYGIWVANSTGSNSEEMKRIFRNNISYDNKTGPVIATSGAVYTHDHNCWDTPGIKITDSDFISLDTTGMTGPRKADGSLPDIDFMKLAPGSQLIDAGTTATGLEYNGSAPDLGAWEYGGESVKNISPTAGIISPVNGQEFTAPADILIEARADDQDGSVSTVEFFNGNTRLGIRKSAPWSHYWNDVPAGSYTLRVRVTDNNGAVTESSSVRVEVSDEAVPENQPPSASILSPSEGDQFKAKGPVRITASATDADGTVTRVEFYANRKKLGERSSGSWVFNWEDVIPGAYSLTIVAFDDKGAESVSFPVNIHVMNNIQPSVEILIPPEGMEFVEPPSVDINAQVLDRDGVIEKLEFFSGDVKLGERMSYPWRVTWDDPPPGRHIIKAVATDYMDAVTESEPVEMIIHSNIKLYPNPSDGVFQLELSDSLVYQHVEVRVITLEGRVIYSEIFPEADKQLHFNLPEVAPGIYSVMIIGPNRRYVNRLVKQ